MPASTDTQKGTAMDYLSAPRDSGIVKSLMALIGFSVADGKRLPAGVKIDTLVALNELLAVKGGRLPAGVKYDTLIALNEMLSTKDNEEFNSMLATRVVELQGARRTTTSKVAATPESIIAAVKSGKINLAELKDALASIES